MGAGTEPQQNLIAGALRLLLSDDRFAGTLSGGSLPVEDALDEVLWTDPPMANYAVHYPVRDVVYEGGVAACRGPGGGVTCRGQERSGAGVRPARPARSARSTGR